MTNAPAAAERLRALVTGRFEFVRGHPLPLGASLRRGGINFAVPAAAATNVTLVLYLPGDNDPVVEWPLDPRYNRTGDVWHAFISGLDLGVEYGWRVWREPDDGASRHVLLDPYARAIAGVPSWRDPVGDRARRGRVIDDDFDWGAEQPLNRHLADSVIYEIHVRGFTADPSSGVAAPGTYRAMIEKIPYLRELGVTAVELLPITEFEENDNPRVDPETGRQLCNFWGYQTLGFFAPKAGFSASKAPGSEVRELKEMVRAFHEAGIEVILDIVFNHSGEGGCDRPPISFRGFDNATWYMIDDRGGYRDYTGCGNTLDCNHPMVRSFVLECLRYWVAELHIDGFRFDLASVLGRDSQGRVLANPPVLEAIAADPVLAHVKIIAEAWDAAGLYQVGTFPHWRRWAEWNGRFRDDVRRFVRGEPGMVSTLATRLAGSADLYEHDGRAPHHSINFVTSHDGFTLADLVAYDRKHNLSNGEMNADGNDDNLSWNCGVEGATEDAAILALRLRQQKNFATLLLVASGTPMILGGDEAGRTQLGNNNAWCQDSAVSWFDWRSTGVAIELHRFFSLLIRFRHDHAVLRPRSFDRRIHWHGTRAHQPDWSSRSYVLAMQLVDEASEDVLVLVNAYWEHAQFDLVTPPSGTVWRRVLDTSLPAPRDIVEPGAEESLVEIGHYALAPRASAVLLATRGES
jgi:glycogen operon protein